MQFIFKSDDEKQVEILALVGNVHAECTAKLNAQRKLDRERLAALPKRTPEQIAINKRNQDLLRGQAGHSYGEHNRG